MAVSFLLGMILLAVSPGPGVAMVVSRTLHAGFGAGIAITTGLIVGDSILLTLALVGLSTLAATAKYLGIIFNLLGAGYLIWLGYQLWRPPTNSSASNVNTQKMEPSSDATVAWQGWREIGVGLFVSLGNPKPILFYGALMPTLLDLSKVTIFDWMILVSIVAGVSYVVLGIYAWLADRARQFTANTHLVRRLDQLIGTILIVLGLCLLVRLS